MIPFGLTEKQFVARYRKFLDKSAHYFINELRQLFTRPVPPTVTNADVEIFLNGEDDFLIPEGGIYYAGENAKIDRRDPSIFPGRVIKFDFQTENIGVFDSAYFDGETFDGKNLAADTIKAWFTECWWKAGGWDYPVPVTLDVHDNYGDGKVIDLTEKRFKRK